MRISAAPIAVNCLHPNLLNDDVILTRFDLFPAHHPVGDDLTCFPGNDQDQRPYAKLVSSGGVMVALR